MKRCGSLFATTVLLAAVSGVLGEVATAYGEVTTGLDPESGGATCPAGYGLEDFEGGIDGMHGGGPAIASTIPGVEFIATQGQDWWTGDWGTGQYNGKYPSGSYTSGGQKWAWLGVSQGSGIIDFTEGDGSYVSVYASTFSGMVVDAYADDGTFLESSGWAGNNIGTGLMTQLSISRPTADIGYVSVHDTGNYWLIDWLCTDAPGVGQSISLLRAKTKCSKDGVKDHIRLGGELVGFDPTSDLQVTITIPGLLTALVDVTIPSSEFVVEDDKVSAELFFDNSKIKVTMPASGNGNFQINVDGALHQCGDAEQVEVTLALNGVEANIIVTRETDSKYHW